MISIFESGESHGADVMDDGHVEAGNDGALDVNFAGAKE